MSVGHVIVEADGGARGNPGPAGYGAVVRDPDSGDVLAERLGGLGNTTNNVAEYSGLIAGLEAARELGAESVDVRMDSKLVVEQMSGRWKIRHAQMQSLALRAQKLARGFHRVSYEWIPRARNSHADRLANEAMDAQAAERDPAERPVERDDPADRPVEERPDDETTQTSVPAAWSGARGEPTRLLLVRHGQTEYSVARRYSGHGDPELTEAGMRQAKAIATRLTGVAGIAAVVSSPLARARQTAEQIADGIGTDLELIGELIETHFGAWEGLTFTEAAERDPEVHRRWLSDPAVSPPGGESFDSVYSRVCRARDTLLDRYSGATLAVVSHVTPIKSLLRMGLDAGPSMFFRLHLDIASLSIVEFYPDGNASVRLVNDTSHLR